MNSRLQNNGTPLTTKKGKPRVKGIYQPILGKKDNARIQLSVKIPPIIMEIIEEIAHDEGRTIASVADEIFCDAFGVDYRNGKLLSIEKFTKKGKGNVIQMFPQEFRRQTKRRKNVR